MPWYDQSGSIPLSRYQAPGDTMNLKTQLAAAAIAMMMTLPAMAASKVCDARTYGAKADGTTKDTKAIQAAIDDCAKAGGGTVKLAGGTFVSGPVVLKSNITLDIAKGATLF